MSARRTLSKIPTAFARPAFAALCTTAVLVLNVAHVLWAVCRWVWSETRCQSGAATSCSRQKMESHCVSRFETTHFQYKPS